MDDLTDLLMRFGAASDQWLWRDHPSDDEVPGYGCHMSQMLYRLPIDGQTDDMRASIETMLADLRTTLMRLAAVQTLADRWELPSCQFEAPGADWATDLREALGMSKPPGQEADRG